LRLFYKHKILICKALGLLLLTGYGVCAQPVVNQVKGNFAVAETLRLQTAGFGPAATILLWGDFENGFSDQAIGSNVPVIGNNWAQWGGPNTVKYSAKEANIGNLAVRLQYHADSPPNGVAGRLVNREIPD